jgi:poly-gamma-glutamate synthesis protein (capsule biosynthesis protein)
VNLKLIIFASVSLLWCFLLGWLVYGCNLSAEAILFRSAQLFQPKPPPVTILAFGDMMLDRKVREQINAYGPEYPFALIKDFLRGDGIANDIVVANAEGAFTKNVSVTLGRQDAPLQFTFDPAILPTLKKLGFTLLGQTNNHMLDFGLSGYDQSTSSIETAGLNWFGDPRNQEVKPFVTKIHGEKITFIGYSEFAHQGMENVLQAIREAKTNSSYVVVCPHWGEEYEPEPNSTQQENAYAFIDAGADVVLGSHPHVIQPIEMYHNKIIFYSLGNFIFDQAATGPTSRGLAVRISLTRDFAMYDLFPFSILKQQAVLMNQEYRLMELSHLNVQSGKIVVQR